MALTRRADEKAPVFAENWHSDWAFLEDPPIGTCLGYLEGIEGMDKQESLDLLLDVHQWQTREEFQYTHEWEPGMFVMWDNRSCLHRAYGGYDGYDRELHRITVYSDPGRYL